jgi:hypothetical protein
MPKSNEVVWTGKNLAEIKKLHRDVAHYPEAEGEDFPRDASQHPDNLHIATDEGHTLVLGIGDALAKDKDGNLSVVKGNTVPRKLGAAKAKGRSQAAEGNDTIRGKGGSR